MYICIYVYMQISAICMFTIITYVYDITIPAENNGTSQVIALSYVERKVLPECCVPRPFLWGETSSEIPVLVRV